MKIKTLAGGLLAAGLAFGLAACGSAKVNAAPPTAPPATTAPAASPATAAPTIQSQMVAWWATAETPFTAVQNDLTKTSAAADRSDTAAMGAGCAQLITDVQTFQGDPPAPAPSVNTPMQAAMTAYAKAGAECQTGIAEDDVTQIDAVSADLTVGDSELAQASAALHSLVGT